MSTYSHAAGAPLLTAAEYARLPDEPGYRTELVHGRVVREPLPGGEHGVLAAELFARIAAHVREHRLGRALIETGFQLPNELHTVRGPDVSFIAAARLPAETPRGFWQLAPDLAVEVRSPTNRWPDIEGKVRQYLAAGTRLVWVVEVVRRRVTVFRPGAEPQVLGNADMLDGGDVLPGFAISLAELFATL